MLGALALISVPSFVIGPLLVLMRLKESTRSWRSATRGKVRRQGEPQVSMEGYLPIGIL